MCRRLMPLLLGGLLCLVSSAFAQSVQVGVEADVLPYATGGWYASGWFGRSHIRIRVVASQVELPDFTIKGDFHDGESRAYAGLVDYFPRAALRGPWLGGGLEHWRNRIGHPAETVTGEYRNVMATLGGGWVFDVGRHIYINPWAAGHVRVGGDTSARVGTRVYEPPAALAEASVKVGVRF